MERGLSRTVAQEPAAIDDTRLRARAERLADRYPDLATQAETAAVSWRWATPTSGRGDVEPLRLERIGRSPGRWLDRPPAPRQEHEAIGFDALSRVVCVRQYDATGTVWLERFAWWGHDAVEVVCFRPPLEWGDEELPAELQSVTLMRLAAGTPVASERYMPPTRACSRERYRHERDRLTRVEEDSYDGRGGLATVVKEPVYGDDGRLTGVDALGPAGRKAVWRSGQQPARIDARPPVAGRLRGPVCA